MGGAKTHFLSFHPILMFHTIWNQETKQTTLGMNSRQPG